LTDQVNTVLLRPQARLRHKTCYWHNKKIVFNYIFFLLQIFQDHSEDFNDFDDPDAMPAKEKFEEDDDCDLNENSNPGM
jgi:hypothetical protein